MISIQAEVALRHAVTLCAFSTSSTDLVSKVLAAADAFTRELAKYITRGLRFAYIGTGLRKHLLPPDHVDLQ